MNMIKILVYSHFLHTCLCVFASRLGGPLAALVSVVRVFRHLWWRAAIPISYLQLYNLQRRQTTEQDL